MPAGRLGVAYDTAWSRRYPARLARAVVMDNAARPIARALASPEVRGLDRLADLPGPAIFASNHASHLDTALLVTSLPPRLRHHTVVAAGADYFFDTRLKAVVWSGLLAAIPIERRKVNRRSSDLARELLEQGWSVVIFPEGTRTPDGWAQPFRGGAAYLAVRTGVPVVPVHLAGTYAMLPKGRRSLRRGSTTVAFGPALVPGDQEDARRMAVRIEAGVAALADETATDWWSARRRAGAGTTPTLSGPEAGPWRRAWALGDAPSGTGQPRGWPSQPRSARRRRAASGDQP